MKSSEGATRGDVVIAEFPGSVGREIKKRRPYVVVSPDDINAMQWAYILAPLTTGKRLYRYRVPCHVGGRAGHVVLDQLRMRDALAVSRPVARITPREMRQVLATLREMFEE
jgi:mRNA interferase MazF